MGIIAVGVVVFFSAYELTTFQSVSDMLGGIAQQPNQASSLYSQYSDMDNQFRINNYTGVFTFHYGAQDIDVTGSQARGKNEDQIKSLVLDKYATNFYNGNVAGGSLATVAGIVGASANGFYFLMAVLLLAAFVIIIALSFIQKWYETTKDMLKSAGKIILIIGVITFIVFLFLPSVIKSVMWASISTDLGRDVLYVIEPRITGTFLVNNLIVVLFGALLYGAGFLIHINTGEGEPDAMGYLREPPRMRQSQSIPKISKNASKPPDNPKHRQL